MLTKGSATDGVSGGGLLASNKVNTLAQAFVEFTGLQGTIEADGDVTVSASDTAAIESHSTVVQSAIVENTAAGIADYLSGLLPTDNDFTTKSGTWEITPGSRVRIAADDGGLGVVGHVYEYEGTTATIDLGSAAADYLNTALWTDLTLEPVLADFYPGIGNLTKSNARAVGILIVLNDVRSTVEAFVDNTIVDAGGAVTVSAAETAQILSEATSTVTASGGSFYGGGSVLGVNGQIVTNLVFPRRRRRSRIATSRPAAISPSRPPTTQESTRR